MSLENTDNQPAAGSEEALIAKLTRQYSNEATPENQPADKDSDRESDNAEEIEQRGDQGEVESHDSDHDDADGETADDENPDEPDDEPETFTVKINGKEEQVSRDELIAGYQKDADYRKKTAELARKTEEAEAKLKEVTDLQQQRSKTVEELSILSSLIEKTLVPQAQLDQLLASDPAAYIRAKADNDQRIQQINALRKRGEVVQSEVSEAQQKEAAARIQAARSKFVEAMPYISQPENERKFVDYATKLGYSAEQIAATDDANLFIVMEKARKFDEMQAKAQIKPSKPVPKVANKGTASRQTSKEMHTSKVTDADRRFKKSGSVDDMAQKLIARYTSR